MKAKMKVIRQRQHRNDLAAWTALALAVLIFAAFLLLRHVAAAGLF